MKKLAFLILAIFILVLIYFNFFRNKPVVSDNKIQKNIKEELGVKLPAESQNIYNIYSYKESFNRYNSSDDINTVLPEEIAGCDRNSIPKIMEDFGFIWGDNPPGYLNRRKHLFSPDEVLMIRELLVKYYVCRALSAKNNNSCSELPDYGGTNGMTVARYCRDYYSRVAFVGFMAGKEEFDIPCRDFLSSTWMKTAPELNPDIFCAASKNGLPDLCDSMKGKGYDHLKDLCYSHFSKKASDCDKKWPTCPVLVKLHEGIKKSNPELCPEDYREICSAYIYGKNEVCSNLKEKLIKTYCSIYSRVQKDEEEWLKKEEENQKAKKKTIKKF